MITAMLKYLYMYMSIYKYITVVMGRLIINQNKISFFINRINEKPHLILLQKPLPSLLEILHKKPQLMNCIKHSKFAQQ